MNLRLRLLLILQWLKVKPLNDEQLKHSATTFRLFGFAVLAGIGWPAFNAAKWLEVIFTVIVFVFCQYIALLFLEDVE